jgi:putative Holliday junction resolvase
VGLLREKPAQTRQVALISIAGILTELIGMFTDSDANLVVGIPLTMHGTTQVMTETAERFARQLEGRYHMPVYRMDERLSTFEARERAGDIAVLDAVAAQAILESWMHDNCGEFADNPDHTGNKEHAGP